MAQSAPDQAGDAPWKKLEFLLGKWVGSDAEMDTPPGAGQGGFSFELELNQKIVVRRNLTFPASDKVIFESDSAGLGVQDLFELDLEEGLMRGGGGRPGKPAEIR